MKKLLVGFVFILVFLCGFVICLFFSVKASKLWVAEEDIRRAFYYESKAVEMYNSGNISAARDNIVAASALVDNIVKRNEWDLFTPLFIIVLQEPESRENYNKCLLNYLDKVKEYGREKYDSKDYCSVLGEVLFERRSGGGN
ncbi:hypothetical protein [Delftia acidovorans]|jgi:hypothetical protein|uniref:hypothetical protein n=2 Tax=Bacteria TaxID=2 RepID=UPI00241E20AD|nr:hypothetical protein [Delftia acidovorans]